jgi:hypothetical protein
MSHPAASGGVLSPSLDKPRQFGAASNNLGAVWTPFLPIPLINGLVVVQRFKALLYLDRLPDEKKNVPGFFIGHRAFFQRVFADNA